MDCTISSALPHSYREGYLSHGLYGFSGKASHRRIDADHSLLVLPGKASKTLFVHYVRRASIIDEYSTHAVSPHPRGNDHGPVLYIALSGGKVTGACIHASITSPCRLRLLPFMSRSSTMVKTSSKGWLSLLSGSTLAAIVSFFLSFSR